jgi:hypothetical protein
VGKKSQRPAAWRQEQHDWHCWKSEQPDKHKHCDKDNDCARPLCSAAGGCEANANDAAARLQSHADEEAGGRRGHALERGVKDNRPPELAIEDGETDHDQAGADEKSHDSGNGAAKPHQSMADDRPILENKRNNSMRLMLDGG